MASPSILARENLKVLAKGVQAVVVLVPAAEPQDPAATPRERAAARSVLKLVLGPENGVSASLRPHNPVKEVAALRKADHANVGSLPTAPLTRCQIIKLLDYSYDRKALEHIITLPLQALRLTEVLTASFAADERAYAAGSQPPQARVSLSLFVRTAQGLLSALAHLHAQGISHRDVKPANIMLSWGGEPVLKDFGTAWDEAGAGDDIDPDEQGGGKTAKGKPKTTAVGTGPYRAPELLFGPNDYDPRALDLWGAGATLAEFFRQTGPYPVEPDSGPDSSDEELGAAVAAVAALKIGRRPSPTDNERTPLFNAAYGDLGLAGSIFRILGTPTKDSWPTFDSLPDAHKMFFDERPAVPLASVLPGLNEEEEGDARADVVRVLGGLVRLEAAERTSAADALALLERTSLSPHAQDKAAAAFIDSLLDAEAVKFA
ncbi:Cyclin-dependent kinase 20 [Vanrija pseudolonga]|uniref:Cyclin-dependent kinase 20 n=1 Tax=Vanrija pseudolonga TaxID=143232 RepID=A0AAF0YIU5_9TREE|nr:Cyclin-dependent kinase 20 [Vanrija pseudolonga]